MFRLTDERPVRMRRMTATARRRMKSLHSKHDTEKAHSHCNRKVSLAFFIPVTLTLLFTLLVSKPVLAKPDVPLYDVAHDQVSYIDFPVYFISDETRALRISDIAAHVRSGEVISSRYTLPKEKAVRWFIFDVRNASKESVTRIVRLDEAIFDEADLYYQEKGKWVRLQGGLNLPLIERSINNRAPTFAVTLEPGETRRLYLKFYASNSSLTLGVRLESPEEAILYEQKFLVFYMLFFGAVGALLAYNFFLMISLREIIYFYYVMHGICYLIWTVFYTGFDFYFHDSLAINNGLLPVVPLVAAFHIMFMRKLLDLENYMPRLNKVILGIAWYFFIMSAGVVIKPEVYPFLAMSTPALTLFLIGVGAYGVYRKLPMASFYLVATLGNTSGTFLLASVSIGILEYSFFARHGYLLGFAMEMIIFALALASRVKRLENEKFHYQKEITKMEAEAREKLEVLVDRRTKELKISNLKLEKLSQTDGLTGLQNRRYFNEMLQCEWKRMQRSHGVLSIIMCDIDYFKKFNDHYGHVEGDSCLKRVARTIMDSVGREGDTAARYGGEEFVVLMADTNLAGAEIVARRILAAIHKENIPHSQSPFSYVTMSFGVAEFYPSLDQQPEDALREVDAMLYKAKEQGRAQVVTAPEKKKRSD